MADALFHICFRNIPALLTECTKDYLIYLERKDGMRMCLASQICPDTHVFIDDISHIITHHAEDGSGVGSAIIAGERFL